MQLGDISNQTPSPAAATLVTPSQREVLDCLQDAGGVLTVRQLAHRIHRHASTVREHLGALAEQGLVANTRRRNGRRGRPAVVWYAVSPPGESMGDLAALLASEVSRLADDPAGRSRELGRSLAAGTARTPEQLTHHLTYGGFEARFDDEGGRVVLGTCPYAAAAMAAPEVVCAMHAGMVDRLVEAEEGMPARSARLEPKPGARGCLVHLAGPGWSG